MHASGKREDGALNLLDAHIGLEGMYERGTQTHQISTPAADWNALAAGCRSTHSHRFEPKGRVVWEIYQHSFLSRRKPYPAFYDFWKKKGDAEPARGYLGASIIGHDCDRYLWFTFRNCVTRRPLTGGCIAIQHRTPRGSPDSFRSCAKYRVQQFMAMRKSRLRCLPLVVISAATWTGWRWVFRRRRRPGT